MASSHPDAPAVICGAERLTYRELDHRAAELAEQLRAAGARAGEVVAFSLTRGADALCAMLAILKSGCAYLPLDPTLPSSSPRSLGANRRCSNADNWGWDRSIRFGGRKSSPFRPIESAAFVLFTSGSTGSAKGRLCAASGRSASGLRCGLHTPRN